MKIKDEVSTVGDEDAISGVETFFLDAFEFVEEGRDMNDDTRADEIKAIRINKT